MIQVKKELASPFYFFDAIYCINLEAQTTHWEKMQACFRKLGILHRIRRFSLIETNPDVAYALSHQHIIERAQSQGLKNVLVITNDLICQDDIKCPLEGRIEQLKQEDWTCCLLNQAHPVENRFQAIAYHHSIFAELLENLPSDSESMKLWLEPIAVFNNG